MTEASTDVDVQAIVARMERLARTEAADMATAAPHAVLPSIGEQRAAAAAALGDAFPSLIIAPREDGIADGVEYTGPRRAGVDRRQPGWRILGRWAPRGGRPPHQDPPKSPQDGSRRISG